MPGGLQTTPPLPACFQQRQTSTSRTPKLSQPAARPDSTHFVHVVAPASTLMECLQLQLRKPLCKCSAQESSSSGARGAVCSTVASGCAHAWLPCPSKPNLQLPSKG